MFLYLSLLLAGNKLSPQEKASQLSKAKIKIDQNKEKLEINKRIYDENLKKCLRKESEIKNEEGKFQKITQSIAGVHAKISTISKKDKKEVKGKLQGELSKLNNELVASRCTIACFKDDLKKLQSAKITAAATVCQLNTERVWIEAEYNEIGRK